MSIQDNYLQQIRKNRLLQHGYEVTINQLCVLNNQPRAEVKRIVDELVRKREIKFSSHNDSQQKRSDLVEDAYKMLKMDPKRDSKKNGKSAPVQIEGKIQGTKNSFAFLIPFNRELPDVFIEGRNLKGAFNKDKVLVEVNNIKDRKPEGKVVKIIERGNENVVGKIKISNGSGVVTPDDVKFGKDVHIPAGKLNNARHGEKVVVQIEKFYTDNKSPEGTVVEVLGMPNQIETEVMAIIRSYNLYEEFPQKVKDAAAQMPTEINPSDYPRRLDLTAENIFTIDGEDTRDIDDAIDIKKNKDGTYKLGVHIADVGEYVPVNSVIDKEAFKRATSIYFPKLVLPMLPRELSNGICSLNEGELRLSLSCIMDINTNGEIVNYKIAETIIKSQKRLTYTIVQAVLDGNEEARKQNQPFVKSIEEMQELNEILIRARDRRGAINFDIPEVHIETDELGDVTIVEKKDRLPAHMLIESFMVVANECVAKHFNERKIPFVYRIHEKPDEGKISSLLRIVNGFGIKTSANAENIRPLDLQRIVKDSEGQDCKYALHKMCLRSLKKAKYSPVCMGHFGLASTDYCHFTAPIRRYPDVTIHRIIKDTLHGKLNGKAIAQAKQFVAISADQSSEKEMDADYAERDVDDLYKVFYMTKHIGEIFEGRISSVTAFGVFVELDNTVEGLIRLSDLPGQKLTYNEDEYSLRDDVYDYRIGQKVKVKAVRADVLAKEIDFVIIKE